MWTATTLLGLMAAAVALAWLWARYGLARREAFEVAKEKSPPPLVDRPRISAEELQRERARRAPLPADGKSGTIKDVYDYLTDDLRARVSAFGKLEPSGSVDYLPLLSAGATAPVI